MNIMKTIIKSLIILLPGFVNAQDLLFKSDNLKLEVKVLEVNENTIRYKVFNNPDGPVYTISKKDVAMVIYKNGTHEVFKASVKEERPVYSFSTLQNDTMIEHNRNKKFIELTKTRNIGFINLLGFGNS